MVLTRRLSRLSCVLLTGIAAGSCGCGTQRRPPLPLSRWLSSDAGRRTVTITVIPADNPAYNGFNFNGYGKGQVDIVVPVGWRVTIRCLNTGLGGRHSCALVSGADASRPALAGASSPDPDRGLAHGRSASFSFTAPKPRAFRIASLVPGEERAGMWDVLEIKGRRRPTAILLRRT